MGNLNQIIMILHRLTVLAEQMLNGKTVVFLGVEAVVFNGPSAPSIKNARQSIFMRNRQIGQELNHHRLKAGGL